MNAMLGGNYKRPKSKFVIWGIGWCSGNKKRATSKIYRQPQPIYQKNYSITFLNGFCT